MNQKIKAQIIIWANNIIKIGGIETFIYNFCKNMCNEYNIVVMCHHIDPYQKIRLIKLVDVVEYRSNILAECDTVITNNILADIVPENIKYKKKIQMVHACKIRKSWIIPQDNDLLISVSSAVVESFDTEITDKKYEVINNITIPLKPKRVLHLISATRLTEEKGWNRMIRLANIFHAYNIPFIWYVFSNERRDDAPEGMIFFDTTLDIIDYINSSDYLVQLSDSESFCYSIVESLLMGIPVISTPLPILKDIGVKDGENGFVVPFDMKNIDVNKIYNSKLKFNYEYKNEEIIGKWKEILGKVTMEPTYKYSKAVQGDTLIECKRAYKDSYLNKVVNEGEIILVPKERANKICNAGFCDFI